MRKLLIGLLLASVAAAPAVAASAPVSNSNSNAEQHRSKGPRGTRSVGSAPQRSNAPKTAPMPRGSSHGGTAGGSRPADSRTTVRIIKPGPPDATPRARLERQRVIAPAREQTPRRTERVVTQRTPRQPADRNISPSNRTRPNIAPRPPVVSRVPRPHTEPPLNRHARPRVKPEWNTGWRNNRQYNWREWRQNHRERFRPHLYSDPFGWGYSRYWPGWRLWPAFYASRYWIMDPWYYRLPPAPPGTHWVRYYNDALLVDMSTGEVLDVIYDFFG